MGRRRAREFGFGVRKKKDLTSAEDRDRVSYQSAFKTGVQEPETMFLAPEIGSATELGDDDSSADLTSASNWDVATRYHEFKTKPSFKKIARQLRRLSAQAILDRAQAVLGSVVHPVEPRSAPLSLLPPGVDAEIDLEETIEAAPFGAQTDQDIWMSYTEPRRQSVVLCVDTSLSMTGEKLALTAVALAVVLLQFPDDPVGIVAFENEAKVLKKPGEKISVSQLVERFLDVPAQGYTHLEDGMRAALDLSRVAAASGRSREPSTVLLSDGKYTAGRDPAYLASRFSHLVVLKMGNEKASLGLCRELAQRGHGALREVSELEALPSVMYGVVKDLLRGRSLG